MILVAYFDIGGLLSTSANVSQDLVLRWRSIFYDQRLPASGEAPAITVVLIDDATRAANGDVYPLPLETLRQLIMTIQCAGPKAIFVDLLLTRRPPSDDDQEFQDFVHQVRASGASPLKAADEECDGHAPILLADVMPQEDLDGRPAGELPDALRKQVLRVPINWIAPHGAYPLVQRPSVDWLPSHWDRVRPGRKWGPVLSPAVALWLATRHPPTDGERLSTRPAEEVDQLDRWAGKSMVVRWGYFPPRRPRGFDKLTTDSSDCANEPPDSPPPGWWYRQKTLLKILGWDLVGFLARQAGREPGDPYTNCLFQAMISAETVLELSHTVGSASPLKNALADRVVLIGTSIGGLQDLQPSPVQGALPGVFLHAMALDDLWRSDGQVLVAPEEILGLTIDVWLQFLLLLIVYALFYYCRNLKKKNNEYYIMQCNFGQIKIIYRLMVFLSVVVFVRILHWPPPNWIGLVIGGMVMEWLAKAEEYYE